MRKMLTVLNATAKSGKHWEDSLHNTWHERRSLKRTERQATRTFGELLGPDGKRLCYFLEDAVRQIEGQPMASWKVHGATAIPTGLYRVTLTVNGVPGLTGVRMHAGNIEDDTEGCPLLGMAIGPLGIVGGTSRPAVGLVKEVVRQAIAGGEIVIMDVVVVNP